MTNLVQINPWKSLPASAPYVLPVDAASVAEFNARVKPIYELRLEIIPEPYLGNPHAPVIFLNLNPGFSENDIPAHLKPAFHAAARANLLHERVQWPFYLLDPELPSPGKVWWDQRLKWLIEAVGDASVVASNLFVAEIHGYHSRRYRHQRKQLPSQQYTIDLVREGIARDAKILFMRGQRFWRALLPELSSVPTYCLRNVQNAVISPANCPEGFSQIAHVIKAAA